jgi:DUF1009 family protein
MTKEQNRVLITPKENRQLELPGVGCEIEHKKIPNTEEQLMALIIKLSRQASDNPDTVFEISSAFLQVNGAKKQSARYLWENCFLPENIVLPKKRTKVMQNIIEHFRPYNIEQPLQLSLL